MSQRFAIARGRGCLASRRRTRRSRPTAKPPGTARLSRRSSSSRPNRRKTRIASGGACTGAWSASRTCALPQDRADVRAKLDEALDIELAWIANPRRLDAPQRLREDGLYLSDASMEGNGLYVASRLGHEGDDPVAPLV